MANTYTQMYLHVVFAVSGRACVIVPPRREELQKYITGIADHTHVLLGLKPNIARSELIGDITLNHEHVALMELHLCFHGETINVALLTELCCGEGMRWQRSVVRQLEPTPYARDIYSL